MINIKHFHSLNRRDHVKPRQIMLFYAIQMTLVLSLLSPAVITAFGQDTDQDISDNSSMLDHASINMSYPEGDLTAKLPEALIVLPEQILSDAVVISMAAIYNNTPAVFLINNTTINGSDILIDVFSAETYGNRSDYTIQPAQVTLRNLSVGIYSLAVVERLSGSVLYNSSFKINKFGELFNAHGVNGQLQTYKGGMLDNTMYLVPSPANPVCPPELSNYTDIWANATDSFFIGINVSASGGDISDLELSLENPNPEIEIDPLSSTIEFLDNGTSILMLFEVETRGIDPGIYNLTYGLSFKDGSSSRSLDGTIGIGVYRLISSLYESGEINSSIVTPFLDSIDRSTQYLADQQVNISYNASFSAFTLQEPKSPWLHVAIFAAAGSIIGSATEIVHQKHLCEVAGQSDCDIDWIKVAYKAAKGGVAGGSVALLGPSALQAVLVSGAAWGGAAAATEAATQLITTGEVFDYKEIALVSIEDAIDTVAWNGAAKIAGSYVAVQRGLAKGLYQSGSWKKIGELGKSPHLMDRIRAGTKYLERALKLTRAIDILKGFEKAEKYADKIEKAYSTINRFEDPQASYTIQTSGSLIGGSSPKADETYVKQLVMESSGEGLDVGINNSIILLFDASESMDDNDKIENAKIAAKNALSTLLPGDEASLIVFYDCDEIVIEQPFTTNWETFSQQIDSIDPEGDTPLFASIEFAREYMKENARGKHQRIVVLTDGLETCGGSP
jgi:hypothetical protein